MNRQTFTHPIVINTRKGGFGLSVAAGLELARRKGLEVEVLDDIAVVLKGTQHGVEDDLSRGDPDLVAVVRELGDAASAPYAKLEIVEAKLYVEITADAGAERIKLSTCKG